MTRALPAALLALLLLPALPLPSAHAQAAPAEPFAAEPRSGDLATRFRFEAPATLLGPELLQGVAFEEGAPGWSIESEVGTPARLGTGEGVARLGAGPAQRQGTVFLRQEVAVTPGWHHFRVGARLDAGEANQGVLLFRLFNDTSERDVLVRFVAGPQRVEPATSFLVPRDVTRVAVLLRYELTPGQEATVAFDAPSLRRGPRLDWTFEDDQTVRGAVAERAFDRPGAHAVSLAADGRVMGNRTVHVASRAPVPAIRLVEAREGAWALDARGSVDPDGREHLVNGDFSIGSSGWVLDTPEVAGDATMRVLREGDRAFLRLATGGAHPAGSVWAYQEVLGVPRGPLELRADVRDDGDHRGYALVVRELGATPRDTLVEAEPGRGWRTLSANLTPLPGTTHVYVQLRFLVAADQRVAVDFANVTLRPALTYRWTVDGRTTGTDPVVAWPPGREGPRNVTLEAWDQAGTLGFTRAFLGPPASATSQGAIQGPALLMEGSPASWSVADVRFPAVETLSNGAFERNLTGWAFEAGEMGGDATARAAPGPSGMAARIDFRPNLTGALFLVQEVPIRNGTFDFSFLRKDEGVDHYALILRERGFKPRPGEAAFVDDVWVLPSAPEWTEDVRRWRPAHDDSTHVLVHLRAIVEEGREGTLWLDNASFAPARQVRWSLDGVPQRGGLQLALDNLSAGPHLVVANLSTAGWSATHALAVHVLRPDAARLHPTLEGGVRLAWSLPEDAPTAALELRHGDALRRLEGRSGAVDVEDAPANATYLVHALGGDGGRVPLLNATLRRGAFAELVLADPPRPTRGEEVRLVARVFDPSIATLEALLDGEAVPLQPGPDGNWTGVWRVPLVRAGDADVSFRAVSADGRQGLYRDPAPLGVEGFAGGRDATPWLGLLAGAALAAFALPMLQGVRRWRRGG